MAKSRVTAEEMERVVAGESVILPLDAGSELVVMRIRNSIRLTPTSKMATIKAPGAPGGGVAP